jgi:hypothetical protein
VIVTTAEALPDRFYIPLKPRLSDPAFQLYSR